MTYVVENLEKLLNIASPSGDTKNAIDFVRLEFEKLGLETRITKKGALIGTMRGKDDTKQKTLSAHVDTLGGMVKEIKSNGRLKMTQIGGYAWNSVEGEYVQVSTADGKLVDGTILLNKTSVHVYGAEARTTDRDEKNMEIRLDEEVENEEQVKALGIEVGDFIYLNPRTVVTESGFVKSRHLDDKACVATILGMIESIKEKKAELPYTVNFYISNYEEVGHGAAAGIPENTMEFVAIDMAAPGTGQTSKEQAVTICAKDSSGPYDLELKRKLVGLAKNKNIDYKIDIYPSYGSDASAAMRAGWEFKHGLIGPGVDASHAFERTHKKGLEATIRLGIAYILDKDL
jgi:putative aminopeptidase FrvX